jgi:hypothetical protein
MQSDRSEVLLSSLREAVTYQGKLYDLATAASEQTGYDLDFVLEWINSHAIVYDSGKEVTTTDFEDFLAVGLRKLSLQSPDPPNHT